METKSEEKRCAKFEDYCDTIKWWVKGSHEEAKQSQQKFSEQNENRRPCT